MKKRKILFTLPNLNGGGAERVIINIIKSLDREKFDIKLLLIDRIGVYFEYVPEYVEIISLDVKRTRNALPKLIKKINTIKPDILFSTLNRMNLLVLMASFFINSNIKLYVREPNLPSAQIKNNNFTWWYKTMIKILYPRAYKIVAQTDEMNKEIHKYFGIKKEKIITLINPIDKETIDKNLKDAENPFEDGFVNFVAVGRLSHQKGFDTLIEAMNGVVKENKKYRLYILGEGEDRKKLEDLITKSKLDNNVYLLGFQNNPHKYIKYSNGFILSSRWEGLPNVVLESMHIGTPVIMAKVNEYCERLIVENNLGIVVEKEVTSKDLLLATDMKQPLCKFISIDSVNELFDK
jgi:glycosyltransferase involved in cell wall biosynthesis